MGTPYNSWEAMTGNCGQILHYSGVSEQNLLIQLQQQNSFQNRPNSAIAVVPQKLRSTGIMSYVKEYFVKHRELLMGITVFILLDHFIFDGVFKDKLQKLVHNILDKADQKLLADK